MVLKWLKFFNFFVKFHFLKQITSTVRKSRAIKDRISGFFSKGSQSSQVGLSAWVTCLDYTAIVF